MRLWLFHSDSKSATGTQVLETIQQLAESSGSPVVLCGVSSPPADFSKIPHLSEIDAVVFCGPPPPRLAADDWEVLARPILVVAPLGDLPQWLPFAQKATFGFVVDQPDAAQLWAALQSLSVAHERERGLREAVRRGQKRLSDRITIEKAKGILQQRLGISEEQAYRQLRLQSRRQRKQIREIAQALLDAHLLLPVNGQPASPGATEKPSETEPSASNSAGSSH